jgi:hypothetical protein
LFVVGGIFQGGLLSTKKNVTQQTTAAGFEGKETRVKKREKERHPPQKRLESR